MVSYRKYHLVAPSCKLNLARFSALLKIQDGAECGNIADIEFVLWVCKVIFLSKPTLLMLDYVEAELGF